MFKTLLGDSSFWIAFASALLLSLVAMGATAYAWRNKFSETVKLVELHTEAMRSSINGGITVAALTLPLAISLVAYLLIQLRQTQHSIAILLASIAIVSIAIAVGVWNLYSMATVTSTGGAMTITKESLTYFPAQFVFQIGLLLSGLALLGVFCFFFLNPVQNGGTELQNGDSVQILRSPLRVGQSADDVLAAWGRPADRKDTASEETLHYKSPISTFTIVIKAGSVVSVTEQAKEKQ